MLPRNSPRRFPLSLCLALMLLACDPLRGHPDSPPPVEEVPPQLSVTLQATGASCREGQMTLSASIEGGTPASVVLLEGESELQALSAPYQYAVDCATHPEGRFSFKVRARAGQESFESAPVSVVVDRTPPSISDWRPKTSYPTQDQPVEIVFSEPIDPGSLGAAPTTLRDGNGFSVPHQAILSEDGTVLRIVPSAPLRPPVRLQAELVQRDLRDRVGNPLSLPSASYTPRSVVDYWPFARMGPSLGERNEVAWLTLATGSRYGEESVFIAFVEPFIGPTTGLPEGHLIVARWTGSAWERLPPPREELPGMRYPENLQLEVDGAGQPVFAWSEDDTVFVKRFDGTSWQPMGPTPETWDGLKMRLDPEGNPVLLLDERLGTLRIVRWNGTEWLDLGRPRAGNHLPITWASSAGIAVDNIRVVVAWPETPETERSARVFVSEYFNGVWTQIGEPFSGSGLADHRVQSVTVALDNPWSAGDPLVAWTEDLGNPDEGVLYFSRWKYYAGWSPPDLLQSRTTLFNLSHPLISVDSMGEPWVAWHREGGPYSYEVYYRRHRSSGWDPEQLVSGGYLTNFRVSERGIPLVGVEYAPSDWAAILQPQ